MNKNLLGRIKKAKALEPSDLKVLPMSSFSAGAFTVSAKMPDIWQMVGNSIMGVVAVYVTDAAVLTVAREACEGRPKAIKFVGHWLDVDPMDKEPRLAFYAVQIERRWTRY